MSANYTRRRDLFVDSGFKNPVQAVAMLLSDAQALGLVPRRGESMPIAESLKVASERAENVLSLQEVNFLDGAVEWMYERGGDLSTFLWLTRTLSESDNIHLGALVFGLASRLWNSGRKKDAACLIRFLVALDFDFGDLYEQRELSYAFFGVREPNPFVWMILEHLEARVDTTGADPRLHVLELGCGIGNDAMGFISDTRTHTYLGTDLSKTALQEHQQRAAEIRRKRPELAHELVSGDFTKALVDIASGHKVPMAADVRINLVYSYSSLHYFSSGELNEIFELVRQVLEPDAGLFCFAIKGEGSHWDGQGLPLYRPDVWINHDGQSRWFPSRRAVTELCDRMGFEIREHTWHDHWGYSEVGRKDMFHYVITTPRG